MEKIGQAAKITTNSNETESPNKIDILSLLYDKIIVINL